MDRRIAGRLIAVAIVAAAGTASAMPPFARKYETACNTCHTQPPQLNAFGEAFRMNGYQWPEDGDNRGKIKDEPIVMSADANRDAFPDAFLPSDIPHLPAIGFAAGFASVYNLPNPRGNVTFDGASAGPPAPQGSPYDRWGQLDWSAMQAGVDMFIVGRAAPNLTYFAELGFHSPEMTFNIERAMFVWSNIRGSQAWNLKVGRFEPDVSFVSHFRKLVGDGYDSLSRTLGEPSGWSLEPEVNQPGAEINGKLWCGRVRYNVGALANYTGTPPSLGGNGAGIQNDSLDVYAHVATKIGGLRLDGVTPADAEPAAKPWIDNAVWLGAYAYRGKHDVDLSRAYTGFGAAPGIVIDQADTFYKVGADAKVTRGSVWLIGAVAFEHHALAAASGGNAGNTIARNTVAGTLGQLEAEYIAYPWLIPYLNVDYYRGDNPYLVNGGWGAVGSGASAMPVNARQTPTRISELVIRPAVSIHPYMNWKLYAYTELSQFPLDASLRRGSLQFATVVLGSTLDF